MRKKIIVDNISSKKGIVIVQTVQCVLKLKKGSAVILRYNERDGQHSGE